MLCSAQPAQKRNVFLFTTNLSSSQFPKHELSSQSIRKLSWNLKGSSSTQQHQCGDLRGLTNPHILQQQHPLGALEPLCILVNHTPHQYTRVAKGYCCSLNMTLLVYFFFLREKRWKGKICIYFSLSVSPEWGWLMHKAIFRSREQK